MEGILSAQIEYLACQRILVLDAPNGPKWMLDAEEVGQDGGKMVLDRQKMRQDGAKWG